MQKLVDYFVVVGYEQSETSVIPGDVALLDESDYYYNGGYRGSVAAKQMFMQGRAKIVQRFPSENHKKERRNSEEEESGEDEIGFDSNIHAFCQPHKGWRLYARQEPPTYFVSVLTDIKGQRRLAACLTFLEPFIESSSRHHQNGNGNGNGAKETFGSSASSDLSDSDDLPIVRASNGSSAARPIEPSKLFSPKSLVLVSRLEYPELFKSCLSLIYATYIDRRHSPDNHQLETIISSLLTTTVPAPGTATLHTFSLGSVDGDRHWLQSTASLTVPATGSCVYKLFKEIGIANCLKIVCALMADFKCLFFSRSYTKLYDACRAVEALLFPLKYTGVFVPVLPMCQEDFWEFPAAPTPYIIGVHSTFRRLIEQMHADSLHECVKVDLDGASVVIPQCIEEATSAGLMATHGLPHHLYESTLNLLFSILKPDVLHSDELTEFCQTRGDSYFTSNGVGVDTATSISQQQQQAPMTPSCVAALSESSQTNSANTSLHDLPAASTTSLNGSTSQLAGNVTSPTNTNGNSTSSTTTTNSVDLEAIWLDKLIRAVFVRLFAQLFAGYRYCLLIIRINPKPVIGFNKASFLANHGLVDNEFMNRLLDSMSFQRFIEERGPSYRHCDVFDDLYAEIQSQLAAELEQIDVEFRHYSTSSSSSSSQRTHQYQSNSTDYIHNNHHLYHLHHHHHHHHHSQPNHSLVASHIRSIAHKLFKYEYPHTQLPVSFLNSTTTTTTSNNLSKSSVFTRSTKQLQQTSQSVDNKDTVAQNAASKNPLFTHPARSYSKIKLPTLDAFRRIHAETFPHLSEFEMSRLINQNSNREAVISAVSQPKNHLCRPHLVPYGPPIETVRIMSSVNQRLVELSDTSMSYDDSAVPQLIHRPNQYNSSADGLLDPWQPTDLDDPLAISSQSNCARKLETISHYVASIFENNFKEAKKNLNSAYRALRDPRARLHLCACLQRYVKRNQVILNNEQFEYVVKCLNESLSNDTRFDEHGVAYSILPLTTAFYRKLNNGTVDQCIFTRLQSHDVWSNIQFWEMAFYTDVQRSLRPVYLSNEEFAAEQQRQQQQQQQNNASNGDAETATQTPATTNGIDGTMTTNRKKQPRPNKLDLNGVIGGEKTNGEEEKNGETNDDENGIGGVSLYARPDEKTALEICGEQMEKSGQISDEQRENYVRNEQGIIRSHVLHYITQMANMKIPLDINTRIAKQQSEKSSQPSSGYSPNQHADTESPGPVTVNHRPSTVSKSSHRPSASSSSKAQQRNGNGVDGNEDNGDHLPVVACENNSDVDSDNESAYEANESNRYNGESAMTPAEMSSSHDPSSAYLAQLGSDGYDTLKFIGKFVDRVCMEGCLSDQQRLALHANLLDVISMQIQMLETVYSESRRVPARCKPKLDNLKPDFMLHGERCVEPTPLRCYLIPDGREEVCGMSSGGHVLLPAEGALYLTNYRLIFRGVPLNDPLMNDAIVTRSFPVASLINKEKKLGNTSHAQKLIAGSLAAAASETYSSASSQLHDGLQMRSATFQLVKVYFDDEVSVEQVDKFRASLARIRYPNSVMEFFCFGWRHPSSVSSANASASASTPGQEMPPTEFYLNGGQQIGMRFTQANSPVGPLQNSIVNYLSNNAQNGVGANSHHQVNNSTSAAATGDYFSATTINIKTKEKHSAEALRHFAKNTLRKAGLMPRGNQRKLPAALLQQQQGTASQKLQQQQSQMASRTPETMRKSMRHSSQQQQPYSSDFLESYSNGTGTPSNTNGDDENLSVIDENFDSMQPSMTSYQSQTVGGIPMSTNESVSQLERMVENTPAYKDYIRQGLVSWRIDDSSDYSSMTATAAASDDPNAASSAAHSSPFRFCVLNMNYQLCRTYPCVFVVPRDTSDECIRKNAKCHRQNRLPLVVWRHPLTKCVLLRSSGFHGKGFIGMLMKTQASKDASSKFNTIASVSGHNHIVTRFKNQNFEYDTNSSCQASDLLNESFTSSINSASHLKRGAPLYIICEKSQVKSFRSAEMSSSGNRGAGGIGGGSNGGVGGEGSSSSSSNPNRYIFLPVELHEVKDTKNSFKKLCRACVPSAASQELLAEINQHKQQSQQQHQQQPPSLTAKSSFVAKFGRKKSSTQTSLMQQYAAASSSAVASNNGGGAISSGSQPITSANQATGGQTGFFKLLHESKWFEQLKALLDVANMICERMDEGSSVMVALEDGWDLTAQVVALAELMMDPYYRTIEGFCVLVEREWLSMGHRFTRRNNHTIDDQTGFAPIFLQFLDCVYQLVSQHPSAFEFNSFLLEFLAYHSVSNRFRTFLLDSELERVQFGVEKSAFLSSSSASSSSSNQQRVVYHTNVTFAQASSIAANTTCIWQYILKVHYQSARFFNFAYQPSGLCSLRVASDICRLKLWSYYTRENLCTGPMYDLDLLAIGNLNQSGSASNQKQTAPVTTTTTNTSSTNDDLWYPVPIQSAVDYYEQLDPLLPTQYEQLLKQLMRMQNQQQPSTPSGGQLPQVLLNGENEPLGWKQVWDGYYELAENKLSNEIEASGGETSNGKTTANNSNLLLIPNPVSVTKPYLAVATQQQPVAAGQAAHLIVVPTSSHQQYSGSAVTFASTGSSQSSQSQHSSSAASTHSATPPFPKLRHHHIQHQLQQHHGHESGSLGVKYQHEFELAVFSSSAHICSICSRSIKPRDSSQTVTGVKCRNCTIMGHEHCVTVNQSLLNECSGSLILHHQPNTNLATLKDLAEMNKVAAALTTSLPPLDTSSYSMQTSSSCSTTPNSNYSHQQQQQIHLQGAVAMNAASATLIQQPHHYHACKLDTDIGSACVGLNHHQQQQQLNNHHHHHHHNPYHHHNHHHVTDYYTRTDSYGDIDDDEAVVECDDPTHNHHHHLMSESLQQQQQQVEQQNNGGYSVDVDVDVTPSTPYNNYNRTNTSSNYINWSAGLMMNNEHQTYAGYLKKQGALFKQWKERYFVLDSIKHQLRYYDSAQDSLAKGVIDLSDIESINQGLSSSPFANSQQTNSSGGSSGGGAAASSTKKALNIMTGGAHMSLSETEAKSCFEVRTAKRVYAFCASSPQDAYKWVKQLEMCCLDS